MRTPLFVLLAVHAAALAVACSSSSQPNASPDGGTAIDATAPEAGVIDQTPPNDQPTGDGGQTRDAADAAVAGWAIHLGGINRDLGLVVAVDPAGNVYTAGEFTGTGAFGGVAITGKGGTDVFVTKLDKNGYPLWSKGFGGAGDESPTGLAVDAAGNIYLTGWFNGDDDFGFGTLSSPDDFSTFVVKLDALGTPAWAKKLDLALAYNGVLDKTGGIVLAGSFAGTANLGAGAIVSKGGDDIFVARLDVTNGATTYGYGFGSTADDGARAVAIDSMNRAVVVGQFQNTMSFATADAGADAGGASLVSAGGYDAFLAKFDSAGKHVESVGFGGPDGNSASSIALEANDDVRIAGAFVKSMTFGAAATTIACASCSYVAKLDSHGAHVWSKKLEDPQFAYVAVDAKGQTFVTGAFTGTLNVGGAPLVHADAGALDFDAFAAKFDASGNDVWSFQGGTSGSGNGVAIAPSGDLILVGGFTKSMALGPAVVTGDVTSFDAFVIDWASP